MPQSTQEERMFSMGSKVEVTHDVPVLKLTKGQRGKVVNRRPDYVSIQFDGRSKALVLHEDAAKHFKEVK